MSIDIQKNGDGKLLVMLPSSWVDVRAIPSIETFEQQLMGAQTLRLDLTRLEEQEQTRGIPTEAMASLLTLSGQLRQKGMRLRIVGASNRTRQEWYSMVEFLSTSI